MAQVVSKAPWRVFPSRHGILLKAGVSTSPESCPKSGPEVESIATAESFLQHNDSSSGNSEPPLALSLSDEEIVELKDTRLAAAAHYGPSAQEKASNEDFALSAVIRTQEGEFAFAAVADGVSTRTFWSARASRIACIGAYKAVRECLLNRIDPADETMHPVIAEQVATFIDRALADDCRALSEDDTVPSGWDRAIYDKHKANVSAWYRSTLLFGVIGANGGVIGMTGDGGVRGLLVDDIKAREPIELRVMFSEAGKDLTSFVSRGFSKTDIQLLPLRSRDRLATHVIFASDGLDLTLQLYSPNEVQDSGRRCRSRYRDLPLDDRLTALEFLETLSQAPTTVLDNISVARLTWPLPKTKYKWAGWKREKFERWKLIGPDTTEREREDQDPESSASASHRFREILPGWLVPAMIGLAVGAVGTFSGVASIVGFEKLKADLLLRPAAPTSTAVSPQQGPSSIGSAVPGNAQPPKTEKIPVRSWYPDSIREGHGFP